MSQLYLFYCKGCKQRRIGHYDEAAKEICSSCERENTIRGHRSKLSLYYEDFDYNKEKINKIINEIIE